MNGIAAYGGLQQFQHQSASQYHTRSERNIQAPSSPTSLQSSEGSGKLHECEDCKYKGTDVSQLDARSATRVFGAKLLDISSAERSDSTRSDYGGRSEVASRFLGNVAEQLSKATTREEAIAILDTAKQQIGEAREAVNALGLDLTHRADKRLDKVVNTLLKGLDNLEEKFLPKPIVLNTSQASVNYTAEAKAVLDIKTQDGDNVSLRFESSSSLKADATYTNDGLTETSESNVFISSDSKLQIEIEGDLDADEVAAIKGVLTQIDNIAQSFFGGDIEKAIAGLQDFSFDDSELSSVGLDLALRQEITVRQTETTTPYTPAFAPTAPPPIAQNDDDSDKLEALPVANDVKPGQDKETEKAAPAIKKPIEVAEVEADPIVAPLPTADGVEKIRQETIKQVSTEISEFFSAQFNISNGNIESFVEQRSVTQILSTIIGVREQTQAASPVAIADKTAESKAA